MKSIPALAHSFVRSKALLRVLLALAMAYATVNCAYAAKKAPKPKKRPTVPQVQNPATPPAPVAASNALPNGSAASMAWASVADFLTDYQPSSPANGWTYSWNPTGKLGNSSAFAPLKWSAVAHGYNTTGAATPLPGKKKTHNDDYLVLQAGGGHPGKPNYLPISGYTIQPDDGAGLYRLFDSSIAKWDGLLSKNEDGLGVLVYLNNTLLPPAKTVATNGLEASFDRDLGQLKVGDTIWVMVSSLKTQNYDGFHSFDYTIQKLSAVAPIPEPGTVSLFLIALAGLHVGQRRRVTRHR
jgi:hypothetical protein